MVYITPTVENGADRSGNYEDRKEWTFWGRIWLLIGIVNHMFTIVISVSTCYLAFSGEVGLFELHIALPTIGYQFLMAQTIMTFTGENAWSFFMDRQLKKTVHGILGATGSTLAVAGTSMMIYSKSQHFTTPHGILGFVAMLFVLTTFINGPVTYYIAKIKFIRPVYSKLNHYVMGTIGFVLGMSSLILGFQKNWYLSRTSAEIVTASIVLSSLTIILTMRSALVNMFHTVRRLFNN